jgi:3-phenylpropionate/trans-cinnamate dioxygenase ferredoxin component
MSQFVTVARTDEIEPGTAKQVWIDNTPIAICNLDGEFCAISDICTHEEFYLSGGVIEDGEIECPMHRGVFNIRTGEAEVYPAEEDLPVYQCRVVNGEVQVSLTG